MKLAIWYQYTDKPYGGSNNFLRRLGATISKLGHQVFFGYTPGVDAVLINAFVCGPNQYLHLGQVAQAWATGRVNWLGRLPGARRWYAGAKRRGPTLVHRVDGVTRLYGRNTPQVDKLAIALNHFADMTIFQSGFCVQSFQDEGMQPKAFAVVHNGVPLDMFFPRLERAAHGETFRFAAVSWSSNPMKGFSTLAQLSLLPGVSVTFIGTWSPSISPERVVVLGPKTEAEIAAILREHDAFVHAAVNEPSSNAIIEALASGLPTLYRDSGGNRELVRECGLPIGDDLAASVADFRARCDELYEQTLAQRHRFSIDHVASQYVDVISETVHTLHG